MSDDDDRRAALLRLLDTTQDPARAHDLYADDAVLEFPQSGERFVGRSNFAEWRAVYPAEVAFEVLRVRGGGDLWIMEVAVRYDGGERQFGVSVHEFRDGLLVHETIYWGPGWEPPEWRARWRGPAAQRDRPSPPAAFRP